MQELLYLDDDLADNGADVWKIKKAGKRAASRIKALKDKKLKTNPNVSIQSSALQSSATSRADDFCSIFPSVSLFFVPKVDSLQVLYSGPSSCVFDAEERDIGPALAPSQINRRDLNPQSWTKLSRKLYTWTAFF